MIAKVAERLGVTAEMIESREQLPHLTVVRWVYWTVLRDTFGYNTKHLSRIVDRSVSYVAKGVKHIDDALEMDDPEVLRLWDKVKDLPDMVAMEALHPRCKGVMMPCKSDNREN